MESPYRPPGAPLGTPPALPRRALWKAVAAGFAASYAAIALVAIAFAVYFRATEPGLTQEGFGDRMLALPAPEAIIIAMHGLAGLSGGWIAAWVRRGRSVIAALVLVALLAALRSSAIGFNSDELGWPNLAVLGAYAVGALLGGGFTHRDRARSR